MKIIWHIDCIGAKLLYFSRIKWALIWIGLGKVKVFYLIPRTATKKITLEYSLKSIEKLKWYSIKYV